MYLDTFRNTFLHTPININNRRSVVYIYRSTTVTDQCTSDCEVVEYWVVYARMHASKFGVFTQAPCVRATNRYGIIFIGI